MQTLTKDRVTVEIEAPPSAVYALVSDVTRMPELSPEVVGCRWLDGATGPAVGARFEATNRVVGHRRTWSNRPVVTIHEPDRTFAISRTEPFAGTIVWRYDLESDGPMTTVTVSYDVVRPVSRLGWLIIEKIFHGYDRRSALRAGMDETLRRLKLAAEGVQTPVTGSEARPE